LRASSAFSTISSRSTSFLSHIGKSTGPRKFRAEAAGIRTRRLGCCAAVSNRDRRAVVLVEQFKAPALVARRRDDPTTTDGWLVETLAE